MKWCSMLITIIYTYTVTAQLQNDGKSPESLRIKMIVNIITLNYKTNGWSTVLCFGSLPDDFYNKLQNISHPFAITNIDREDEDIEDVVPYYSNIIVINLLNIEDYEETISKIITSPYWHPHANIIIYYHQKEHDILAKIYFNLWYHRAINAVIVQYDDVEEVLLVSHYTPFISDHYKLDHLYGCWTTRRIGMPISGFDEGLSCEKQCHNVSLHSKFRANHLGTCIGFSTVSVPYDKPEILETLNLFEDKGKNLRGFTFRAYATEILPFFVIKDNENGTFTFSARDGMIWNSMSKAMNFTLDLTPSLNGIKKPFNFELSIKQIFDFANRKADLFLAPIYLFDVIVVQVDYTFPYKESGVCIVSHRAGFETALFNSRRLSNNQNVMAQFIICFLCVWITFSIFQGYEKRSFSFDQIGKDLLNAYRNILLITLYNPPKKDSFRIFLTISIWSFFILNFATQAMVISLLTAAKRGKDVETFEDIIEKGYLIYAMASPDLILPDTEERFRIINSRLVAVQNLFDCLRNFTSESHRFCMIDCSVGRYLARNRLNEQGEQYLHIAKDRIHSHYLTILLSKHSALTERFDKIMMTFYEAGLIRKWEHYRYADIKEDKSAKPLGLGDLKSLFDLYCYSLGFISMIFLLELILFNIKRFLKYCLKRIKHKRSK